MTPPENPATPPGVPVPYPNTGMAKDTTSGSKTIKISNKETMLKNKSYFKKSIGDEAGCAAKKGVITSVNRGKVYFISWSMDVKFEGQNVDRHLDLTTHNHASPPGNGPPTVEVEGVAQSSGDEGNICDDHDYECEPVAVGQGTTEEKAQNMIDNPKKDGDAFEGRALLHNKDDVNPDGTDAGCEFRCKKDNCSFTKEVDHVTRDGDGNITKIVQCKSDMSKVPGNEGKKGVIIKPPQLKEDRKLAKQLSDCQKDSGVEVEVEYKLEQGEAANHAEAFLKKKAPPIVTQIP
jgi:hypothetical protein